MVKSQIGGRTRQGHSSKCNNFWRKKDVDTWETVHILHMMWKLHRWMDDLCLQTFQDHVFELRGLIQRSMSYLEQQLETCDALEGQYQKGLERQALADRVTLQLL